MATSLAEQLKRLAVPQTSALQRDKKRSSLLFDPKEAATLSRETIYQIGLEGLEELIQKNEIFIQFEETLFNLVSKDFERSVQNSEANEKLDKSLRKFILLLSPYFLLNCAHKALEWLINRFSIHEYNREDLLMLSLPYHETNIFVRVIQLLKFKDTQDSFYFLKQLQKPGTHLSKHSLLNHSASNCGFLKFVTKYIQELLKHHERPELLSISFNFFCTVFTGSLQYSDKITENQVSQMLPLVLKGLNSPIADFCASSYVVTAVLVSKTNLSDKLLDTFIEKITEVAVPSLQIEASIVLLVIYQSQKQYKSMPAVAVANLSEKDWLPKVLHTLQTKGNFIYPFLERLISSFTHEGVNNDIKMIRDMMKACLDYIKVKDEFVGTILSCILDTVLPKMKISPEAREWLTQIIQLVENQYPTQFDKEVYNILSTSTDKKSIRRRKCLSKILKNTLTYQGKFNLFEKLYHPNPSVRGEALKFLSDNYDSLNEIDKEMINNSFVDRLKDENVSVVKDTLKVIKKTGKVKRDYLKINLIALANKYQKDKEGWGLISIDIVDMLTTLFPSNDWDIFLAIFPFLMPSTSKELSKVKKLLESPFFANNDLLKPHFFKLKSVNDEKVFIKVLLKILASNTDHHYVQSFVEDLKQIPNEFWDTSKKYISFLLITTILPNNSSLETASKILDLLLAFYSQAEDKYSNEGTINEYVEQAILGKMPVRGFLDCLEKLAQKIKKPELGILQDYTVENSENKFFARVTFILMNHNVDYLTRFLKRYCLNMEMEVQFLFNLCASENRILDDNFKNNALDYIKTVIKDNEEAKPLIFNDKSIPIFLLVLLADPDVTIRQKILDIISTFIDLSTRKSNSYFHLLQSLIKSKEEIVMDHTQLPLIMFNTISASNTKYKKNANDLNAIRNNLVKFCCLNNVPVYLKAGILRELSLINTSEILEDISNIALDILENNAHEIKSFNAKVIGHIVSKVDSAILKNLDLKSNTWKLISTFVKNDKTNIFNDEESRISPATLMLNQLDRDFFSELEDENVVKQLLDIIIEISSTAQDLEVLPAASKIFKHIDLDADWIKEQLIEMRDVQSPKIDETKKKRRIGVVPTVDILDTLKWKKGVTVLELIQDKKKIRNVELILPVLFDLLKRCLDFDEQSAVEYPKQLLLSLILHCCTKIEETIPENVFNVELIVQCIRASQNPQTHHHALLVLAHTAHLIPVQVLHHMMAIFTFMGSSVLRHDDSYSFQIISKILDTIIPIVIGDEKGNQSRNVAKVLRVFVDVLLDVPEHRRMPLYKQLLEKMGVKDHLHVFLLLIFEAQVVHNSLDKQRKDSNQRRLDIAAELCREFTPEIVIYNCISLVKYLSNLPDEKEDVMEVDNADTATFDIAAHTSKDYRHFKYLLVKFTTNLLGSPEFVNQVAVLNDEDELNLEPLFKEIIINILQYIQRISNVAEKAANTPQAQYWKVLLHLSYDILDSVNALITSQMFLLVTKGLMVHTLTTVRKRILELLNNKLQYNQQFFEDSDNTAIYSLIPPIITIVESIKEEMDNEQETVVQTALLSLKLLVKFLARQEPEKFVQILEFITGILKSKIAQNNVLASVILCLAELCVSLKGHAITCLPDFMPALIKILKKQKHEEVSSVLLRSLVTTVEKILDSMPLFLSPYLEKILTEVSQLISKWNVGEEEQKTQLFTAKLCSIKRKIGNSIPLRVLLQPVENCYNTLVINNCFNATSALLDILAESISVTAGPEINGTLNELTNFFLNILKFRTDKECTLEEANMVESHIVKAFTVLILKLSENTFRPLYYRLYDWAVRSDAKNERIITFYSLSGQIAQSLKGLFVLFAGHFINNASQVLDACNKMKTEELYFDDDEKNILLLNNILNTLNAVFLYDNQKFINRDRFDILMQPLVDQIENPIGGLDELLKRNKELITPCLVHFAVAVADDALWKQMNYQILLKMRHNSPKIRLATLYCVTEIVKQLGEDFLPLLPETIPFLAELLEDEEEDVEKACQTAVQEMEKVLGEPLQKYF